MMDLYPSTTIGHLPRAADSINEFWSLMVSYLPTRFPTMFSAGTEPRSLFNKVTGVTLSPDVSDPNEALRAISASLDEDWLVLLRAEDGDGYVLGGHIACFPAGFDISQKIGWRIRDIHGPVPQYKAKLQTSMERFFDRMATGTFVRRCNWSVVTNDKLFTAFSQTHYHEGVEKKGEEVRAEQCYQRTESQTLFRLPGGALVFGIKTYLYNVKDIRDEERAARALARADVTADGGKDTDADGGVQSDFADAIEGLTKGSVPEVFEYKRGPVWKDVVVEYLREPVGLE